MKYAEEIRRIRNGDIGQFESLFRSFYSSLVNYAYSILKDIDTAEEIVQDLFLKLWQDRNKIRIQSTLNGYLFRAVHNRCLHAIEHKKVTERYKTEMLQNPTNNIENPSDIMDYHELQERVLKILDRLPERCGMIFSMSRFEGLKYAEIAEKLSVSIKTVEANMGKALKEFRKELTE